MSVEIIDLSDHNRRAVHWDELDPVVEVVIVKATEGINYVDPSCRDHCAGARGSGKMLGLYHYLRVRHGRPQDARQQAHAFAEVLVREQARFAELDCETNSNEACGSAEWMAAISDFTDELEQILNPQLTIYTSKGEWESFGGVRLASWDDLAKYQLSIAAYIGPHKDPRIPKPWQAWMFHQYAASAGYLGRVVGVDGLVDRTRFRGTFDEIGEWAGLRHLEGEGTPMTDPAPPPEPSDA